MKIFPSHYRNYFYNERDIYCLPFMESPSLLTYYGQYLATRMSDAPADGSFSLIFLDSAKDFTFSEPCITCT